MIQPWEIEIESQDDVANMQTLFRVSYKPDKYKVVQHAAHITNKGDEMNLIQDMCAELRKLVLGSSRTYKPIHGGYPS